MSKKVLQMGEDRYEINPDELETQALQIQSVFKYQNEQGRIESLKKLATITFIATKLAEPELLDTITQVRMYCVNIVHDS